MPPRAFTFRTLPLPVSWIGAAAASVTATDESDELGALINGDFSTVAQVNSRLQFQAIGSCPVPLRASVMRVVTFKLLGTGVFAALVAAGSSDPLVIKTCGLAAAINAVAVVHYTFSTFTPSPLPYTRDRCCADAVLWCVRSLAHPSASLERQTALGVDGGTWTQHRTGRLRRAGLPEQLQAVRAGDCCGQLEANALILTTQHRTVQHTTNTWPFCVPRHSDWTVTVCSPTTHLSVATR